MFQVGLAGKTNVGKSTFLKASTLVDVEISNRIFTTIKPNQGVGYVTAECPCKELDKKCNPNNSKCKNGTRLIPIKLLDVAGLIPGAHEGKGLGNQFLDNLREAPVLIHVLDMSGTTGPGGNPSRGHNPEEDIEFFEKEINFWYADIFKREWDQLAKKSKITKSEFKKQMLSRFSGLGIKKDDINEVFRNSDFKPTRPMEWSEEDIFNFAKKLRKVSKPIIIAANKMDLPRSEENLKKVKKKYPEKKIIPCSADFELALRKAQEKKIIDYTPGAKNFEILKEIKGKEKKALEKIRNFLKKYGGTGVQKCLNKAVFEVMDYIVVYPVEDENHWSNNKGEVLPDAHLVPKGITAEGFAYTIHSDIGEKFIGAIDARTKRKISSDHELKNGDIIKILT